jgi:multimeric flavodoxin WrbA
MRVLAFNGSPRPEGNTSNLVNAVLEGSREGGAETTHVMLDELELKGCQGCLSCRKKPGNCARRDGLTPYLEDLKSCDAVLVGCPIYMYHVSGQMKLLVDRLYSFYEDTPEGYRSALPAGKRFALVTSQGNPDAEKHKKPVRWLGGMVGGLDMQYVGKIVHELLDKARRIGLALAGSSQD